MISINQKTKVWTKIAENFEKILPKQLVLEKLKTLEHIKIQQGMGFFDLMSFEQLMN